MEVCGVKLLSKLVGRVRGKTTHTHTHTHNNNKKGGGGAEREERKGRGEEGGEKKTTT